MPARLSWQARAGLFYGKPPTLFRLVLVASVSERRPRPIAPAVRPCRYHWSHRIQHAVSPTQLDLFAVANLGQCVFFGQEMLGRGQGGGHAWERSWAICGGTRVAVSYARALLGGVTR